MLFQDNSFIGNSHFEHGCVLSLCDVPGDGAKVRRADKPSQRYAVDWQTTRNAIPGCLLCFITIIRTIQIGY